MIISYTPLLQIKITILVLHFCAWLLLCASDNVSKTIELWFIVTSIFGCVPPPHLFMQMSLDNVRLVQIRARIQVWHYLYHQQHAQRDTEMPSISQRGCNTTGKQNVDSKVETGLKTTDVCVAVKS